jgi:hypothetical protein
VTGGDGGGGGDDYDDVASVKSFRQSETLFESQIIFKIFRFQCSDSL